MSVSFSSTSSDLPIAAAVGGVRLAVRLTPRARAARIEGLTSLADGSMALRVAVTEPPEDGRANEALLRLLAKEWRLARRDLSIIGGPRNRNKLVQIAGEPVDLLARLRGLLANLPRS